jgi:hypothetical protein
MGFGITRDRLKVAVPKLRARYTEVRRQEDIAAWKAEAEELEARRVALAVEFYKLLPSALLRQIAERLHSMRAFDREIDALNHRRPDDRSARPLDYATPELARDLKLPDPDKPSQLLWPPPQPSPAQLMAFAMMENPRLFNPPGPGPEWWKTIEERNRRALEDNRRQIAEAEQRQREHEEREKADIEKAREPDRAAYAGRGWPV